MLGMFIGTDGSMTLRTGKVYEIEISTRPSGQIDVWWKTLRSKDRHYCPYTSADTFQANWDTEQLKCNLSRLISIYGRDAVIEAVHKMEAASAN